MKLIGCDRCRAIFPPDTRYTELRILDATDGVPTPGFETKELCPVCRADLDAFLKPPKFHGAAPIVYGNPITSAPEIPPPTNETEEIPTHKREAQKRTCESCGHTGFRKFEKTATGWCCWRCIDSQKRQLPPDPEPEAEPEHAPESAAVDGPDLAETAESNIAGKNSTPNVAKPLPAGITARCQDCTRAYTLTGTPLRHAVEMHELKHGHIVNVHDNAGAA